MATATPTPSAGLHRREVEAIPTRGAPTSAGTA